MLRDKLADLPFIEILAGLAKTVTDDTILGESDEVTKITHRLPVCEDTLGEGCEGREVRLNPDSRRKSIIYFEDYGIVPTGARHGFSLFSSTLRLVCWMNRANLVGDHYAMIGGRVMTMIIGEIANKNPENVDIFKALTVKVARIPPADAGLFSRYTYNETDRQYLRPPFEFFGIDFTCNYRVPAKCLDLINWNTKTCT